MASKLPLRVQQELKKFYFGRLIHRDRFITEEPEFAKLPEWVSAGDIVLDIGANIGHYTARLSRLVGAGGRVISFEPVIETFELLSSNVSRLPGNNVSLINAAASEQTGMVSMALPILESGMTNYYMAEIVPGEGEFSVLTLPVDALEVPAPVSFIKIDVEGHELTTLKGMKKLIERDHPVMVIEGASEEVAAFMGVYGYVFESIQGSPNRIFRVTAQ